MSREPNRARSRRVVLIVAVFLAVVVIPRDEGCPRPAPLTGAGLLATLAPLPRVLRAVVLLSSAGKEIDGACAPAR